MNYHYFDLGKNAPRITKVDYEFLKNFLHEMYKKTLGPLAEGLVERALAYKYDYYKLIVVEDNSAIIGCSGIRATNVVTHDNKHYSCIDAIIYNINPDFHRKAIFSKMLTKMLLQYLVRNLFSKEKKVLLCIFTPASYCAVSKNSINLYPSIYCKITQSKIDLITELRSLTGIPVQKDETVFTMKYSDINLELSKETLTSRADSEVLNFYHKLISKKEGFHCLVAYRTLSILSILATPIIRRIHRSKYLSRLFIKQSNINSYEPFMNNNNKLD